MGYKAEFSGWDGVSIGDLVVAYRKAKADCFFENTFPTAIKFSEYEKYLLSNLEALLERLKSEDGFSNWSDLLGEYRLLPKKLSASPKEDIPPNGHVHFSDPQRAVENLFKYSDIKPEFRIVGDFPVDAHVISALWINSIGHKFDSALDKSCYGARLRRISDDDAIGDDGSKPFHVSAIGSFVPYFGPYQRWRNDGLNAIRGELDKGRDVIAISIDLKSYYHFIDPSAICSDGLLNDLGLELSGEEIGFTKELAGLLDKWGGGAGEFSKRLTQGMVKVNGGLVIGLTASRIISNVILNRWDRLIKEKISPVHYGRYVDDMFLVVRDSGVIKSSHDFMLFLQSRLGKSVIKNGGKNGDNTWEIQQGKRIQGNTIIKLQSDKQKLFLLQGRAGIDLLDSIEKEIVQLSSEHRLMPSPDQLEDSTAARVLSASGSVGESADALRRADGLTIRRLSWSLQLRHVETLAHDLPPHEWSDQREEFYQFANNHILRPDSIFSHFSYLPRLLGFAISLNEWMQAEQIVLRSYRSIDYLMDSVSEGDKVSINGKEVKAGSDLWRFVKGTLTWIFIDASARYYDPERLLSLDISEKEKRLSELFLNGIFEGLVEVEDLLGFKFGSEDFYEKAPLVALADLAKEPYKRIVRSRAASLLIEQREGSKGADVLRALQGTGLLDVDVVKEFLKSTRRSRLSMIRPDRRKRESYLPYVFPTRPLTPAEISELAPECVGLWKNNGDVCEEKPSIVWARYTQALRGVWVKPTLIAAQQDAAHKKSYKVKKFLRIGTDKKKKVVVAFTNFKTDDADWAAMACNRANLSRERYQRISRIVNETIRLSPKPDYVIFPELSLPLKWVDSVSSRLSGAGISMIAGTEYRHFGGGKILSEACFSLSDNRLGYPASVRIWQPKLEPAVGEDKVLTEKYGKAWAFSRLKGMRYKPIYVHNDLHFGVMICSELQNSKARVRFQGAIDALMVLSWNQDLDTFSSLIESSALDVHAYTILVNNRKYGDSRVRSPAKESFARDIARVRGGDNDFVVAATLDIDALRAFQSRAKRWPQDGDKFKPLPEGFRLARARRRLPPS